MVALLTLCDANIKTEDRPVDGAARGRLERPRGTVRLLLDRAAQIDVVSDDGSAALHWAVENGHSATIRLLLDRVARIEAEPDSRSTALH